MVYERLPWQDRFNEPSPKVLRSGLSADTAGYFDRARSNLLDMDGVQEAVAWYGQCWCWAIEYRTNGSDDPLALLIPSPCDLQFAMPLDKQFITTLPVARMKRAVRDGLELAQEPFDTNWGIWSLQQGNLLEDMEDLARRKLKHQTTANARS